MLTRSIFLQRALLSYLTPSSACSSLVKTLRQRMEQHGSTTSKKKDNCTYDSLNGFVKQASVWVVGAVWGKKKILQSLKAPHFDRIKPKFERLKTQPKMVTHTRHKAGRTTQLPLPHGAAPHNQPPQSTFCRHCG